MALKPLRTVRSRVSVGGLASIADRAEQMLMKLREDTEWNIWKVAPSFSSSKVAKLCHIERADLNYLCTRGRKDGYPTGTLNDKNSSRMFTLAETQAFVRANGQYRPRPKGQKGIVCGVGNFKADVGKTTCAVGLAQGLTLLGHQVLLIDLDPQASSTFLMGCWADVDVSEELTVMPVVRGEQQDLRYALRRSYWNGLDLIPSCAALSDADHYFIQNYLGNAPIDSWRVLDTALEPLRDQYDVIIIDTPSTLSFLTIAAFIATDGLIVPLPPETRDFASSTHFFRTLSVLFDKFYKNGEVEKKFEFVKVVLSKVKPSSPAAAVMKEWIKQSYHEMVTTATIIETDIAKNAGADFQTIYDIERYDRSKKSLDQALESFDSLVAEIEAAIQNVWQLRIEEGDT